MPDGPNCGDAMRPEGGSRSGGYSSRVWGCDECCFLYRVSFADYASCSTDRRSVSGGVVMCAGGPVSWHSETQKCVTLDYTGGVCGYFGHGEGDFVFDAGLVFYVAEG